MKIVVVHAYKYDFENELYKPLRESALAAEHEFLFPHEGMVEASSTKEKIRNADCVLAEVSYPSTGSGIELGWADMLNVPLLFVHKSGVKISTSLGLLRAESAEYADSSELILHVTKLLATIEK